MYGKHPTQRTHGYFFLRIVTHYAEGSVQPLLVRKLMFTMIPDNAPVLMQPVLNAVFSKLNAKLTDPELRSHAILVGLMLSPHL